MKITLLFICILTLSLKTTAQNTFEVTGIIQKVAYHQGGIEPHPNQYLPKPLTNYSVWIVKYNGENTLPTLIKKVTTDSTGSFTTKLPEGKYGFVLTNKKKELKKGMYLPNSRTPINKGSENGDINTSDYWTLNSIGPFQVTKNGKNHITLTHYNVTICYKCP